MARLPWPINIDDKYLCTFTLLGSAELEVKRNFCVPTVFCFGSASLYGLCNQLYRHCCKTYYQLHYALQVWSEADQVLTEVPFPMGNDPLLAIRTCNVPWYSHPMISQGSNVWGYVCNVTTGEHRSTVPTSHQPTHSNFHTSCGHSCDSVNAILQPQITFMPIVASWIYS